MRITSLSEKQLDSYYLCLEDWSEEIKEAGDHKACWYRFMKDKGLGVKLALNIEGKAVGMIQYLPVEHSYAQGKNLYAILCIWVHGYKQGVGNHQKKGIGKALLRAAEKDVHERGALGMVAWGLSIPAWMKASWFKKQGYKPVDKMGFLGPVLLWKTFSGAASPPKWIRKTAKRPKMLPGQVTVTAFMNGWCPAQNLVYERARRASEELGDKVFFREILTRDRDTFLEWGISDALYINEKKVNTGPPPSFRKIKRKISRQLKRL
jgi:GNAT superfamily N-acetyltransferase